MDRKGVEATLVGTAFQTRGNPSEEGNGSETLLEQKPGSELLSSATERRKKGGGREEWRKR